MKKKSNLPKILQIIGFIMPFLGPVIMVLATDIYLHFSGPTDPNDSLMIVAIIRGIYFGIMLGIACIVISKILREIEKKKRN